MVFTFAPALAGAEGIHFVELAIVMIYLPLLGPTLHLPKKVRSADEY